MIDVKKIKLKIEERRKISNEAFLDMMGEMWELKKLKVRKVSGKRNPAVKL
jgi:hypothetical protein